MRTTAVSNSSLSPWLQPHRTDSGVRLRLLCLPYAGGGAGVFRRWAEHLPDFVDVCPVHLPGREDRIRELPYTRLSLMVRALARVVGELDDDVPLAIFGHSMGALIGYELARQLRNAGGPQIQHLLVAGHRAPDLPDRTRPMHHLPNQEFIEQLKTYGATPDSVLKHPDFVSLFLPLLRADFTVCETYAHRPMPPLACPISVFGGSSDPEVNEEELQGWRTHTKGSIRVRVLPGDHFFLHAEQDALLRAIAEDLTAFKTTTLDSTPANVRAT